MKKTKCCSFCGTELSKNNKGIEGIVICFDNMKEIGMVKVNGMEWTARAKEDTMIIPQGAAVRVVEIRGVKLIVEVI